MITNAAILNKFERELTRKAPVDIEANFRIVEALYEEAAGFGVFPLKDPLDGLDTAIRIAKVVNSVPKTTRRDSRGAE